MLISRISTATYLVAAPAGPSVPFKLFELFELSGIMAEDLLTSSTTTTCSPHTAGSSRCLSLPITFIEHLEIEFRGGRRAVDDRVAATPRSVEDPCLSLGAVARRFARVEAVELEKRVGRISWVNMCQRHTQV